MSIYNHNCSDTCPYMYLTNDICYSEIDSARNLDSTLPEKVWIKVGIWYIYIYVCLSMLEFLRIEIIVCSSSSSSSSIILFCSLLATIFSWSQWGHTCPWTNAPNCCSQMLQWQATHGKHTERWEIFKWASGFLIYHISWIFLIWNCNLVSSFSPVKKKETRKGRKKIL